MMTTKKVAQITPSMKETKKASMVVRKQKHRRYDDKGAATASSSSTTATHDCPPTPLNVSPPSFNAYSSGNRLHQIAARVILELGDARHSSGLDDDHLLLAGQGPPAPTPAIPEDELKKLVVADTDDDDDGCASGDSDDDGDFEFAFVRRDPDTAEIAADELFSDGQIRSAFPVFDRSLLDDNDGSGCGTASTENSGSIMLPLRKLSIAEAPARPPSSSDEGGSGETPYRVWTPRSPAVPPPPGQCKKSRSTGSSSRRWRLRDLIHRSSSDGKDAFVFLPAPAPATAAVRPLEKDKGKNVNSYNGLKKKKIMGSASAHEMYLRSRPTKEDDRRRSFLPYRPGIMGFFSNPSQ